MKEPNRLIASSLGIFMFMASFTYYSELRVQHKAQQDSAQASKSRSPEQSNDLHLDTAR